MAKTEKAAKKTKKAAKSQFHTIQSIQNSADKWMETMKESRKRYVTKPFETGKTFVEDLRNDPIRMVEGWYSDSRDFMAEMSKDPKKTLNGFLDDGKSFVEDLKKRFQATMDDAAQSGNDLYKGVKTDSQKLFDDLVDSARKFKDRIPMMKKIEEGVGTTLQSIPDKLNLPSKKEMDELARAIDTLNQRMNALGKQVAA